MLAALLDEGRGRRAAREGLESDRPRTREEVEEVAARDLGLDDVENRLPHPVLRRTDQIRLRHQNLAVTVLTSGYPHSTNLFTLHCYRFTLHARYSAQESAVSQTLTDETPGSRDLSCS